MTLTAVYKCLKCNDISFEKYIVDSLGKKDIVVEGSSNIVPGSCK
jgi:hypothetical protein